MFAVMGLALWTRSVRILRPEKNAKEEEALGREEIFGA